MAKKKQEFNFVIGIIKLLEWIRTVELKGVLETRKIKGFHDEPLKGDKSGQRSIRLNKAYRAIYTVKGGRPQIILIEEVNKHEY